MVAGMIYPLEIEKARLRFQWSPSREVQTAGAPEVSRTITQLRPSGLALIKAVIFGSHMRQSGHKVASKRRAIDKCVLSLFS